MSYSAGSRFLSIRRRLLSRIFWMAVACGGLAIFVQTLSIYHEESQRFHMLIGRIGQTHVPLLEMGLWDLELDTLQQQLQQIGDQPEIAQVVLESTTGLTLSAGHEAHADSPDARLRIPHPRNEQQALGELLIYANPALLRQTVGYAAGARIFEITVFTALICLVIAYHLHSELGRSLRRIARYAAILSPGRQVAPLKLRRPVRDWHDEIDLVAAGFEQLRQGLQHYADERDRVMAQLAVERDQLDGRVARRTAALQRINGYLDIFSRTLMQGIHLPLGGYEQALHQALQELADYVGASGCGLAESLYSEPWHWRVFWSVDGQPPYDLQHFALETDPQYEDWLMDPQVRDISAYGITALQGGRLLVFRGAYTPSIKALDERRYQKMAAEMLFSLLERWLHVQQLELSRQELERLSRSDPLTGLANRRHFDEYYHQEVCRALREELPLSVLMMDVDHFKSYNDHYGHGRGDDCLIQVGACLKQLFCAEALPARLGGEEFAVLLPGVGLAQAQVEAETLRLAILDLAIAQERSPLGRVTVSVGFAALNQEHYQKKTGYGLLDQADKALYIAKQQGRNRVVGFVSADAPVD